MGEKDRMRPIKMLPVRLSLREFQELDTSAQPLQSQLRPHHVFSRCSKKTLAKKLAGLICFFWPTREVFRSSGPMNLSNLRDDVERLQTRADEIALSSTISGARFSSGFFDTRS